MANELPQLFGAPKTLAITPTWAELDSESLEVVCPLEVDGIVVEGFQFRMTAKKRLPDEIIMAQVEYHPPTETVGPLARIEWRPVSTHNNKGRGPLEWQNKIIRGCHYHRFDLNFNQAEQRMLVRNLPLAVPLNDSPATYSELIVFVGKEFRIGNMRLVAEPQWEPVLI
ncbi:MAG TPA: hypothetical protein PKB01_05900 [Xanthobacteraceae bacterium]|mgnify:CR=1 FL=1|nr:hypothetical protein [Xanthobacteraceae bacterium]